MSYPSNESVSGDQLRAFIERVERMQEERKAISDDIAEIYAEAKGNGFDTKVMRTIVRIRAQDHDERMEQEALLEIYMSAIGMQMAPILAARAPARARAREIIEEFDPITGEITEPPIASNGSAADGGEGGDAALAANQSEPVAPATEGQEAEHPDAILAGEGADRALPTLTRKGAPGGAGGGDATSPVPSNVTTFPAKKWKQSDRPHADCLNPTQCGGFSNLGLCQRCKDEAAGFPHIDHLGGVA